MEKEWRNERVPNHPSSGGRINSGLLTAVILFSLLPSAATQQAESMPIGGPFELVDQTGIKVTYKTFAGSLIFFGYTSCPDACPTTFSDLGWFLYGEGKLRVDHVAINGQNMISDDHWPSRQIIRKRDNKKTRIGTVAMAVQRNLRSLYRHDPHLRECRFDCLVEP